ncbi:hypothetical protein [Roseinatronobacter monicus]|nr:hypothetical protein [Roseinatronobacter monicus]
MSWSKLDNQMKNYHSDLTSLVKVSPLMADRLATTIASEVRFFQPDTKRAIREATPIKLSARLDELKSFQYFMDSMHMSGGDKAPQVVRAQVIIQNYICFVYLSDACFNELKKASKAGTTLRKCAKYLTDNPIRAFRNAIAHSNWTYSKDSSSLVYWARKGADRNEPLVEHTVSNETLAFWQALSRCTAYAAFENL